MLLLEELWSVSNPSHYALVNRTLIRVRFENPALAIEVAKEVSLISYDSMRSDAHESAT